MKIRTLLLGAVLALFVFLQIQPGAAQTAKDAALYQAAIVDAMAPESSEICTTLVEISKSNKNLTWKQIDGEDYLLVVSWKSDKSYYEPFLGNGFYNTGKYPIWISTAPELLSRMKAEKYADADARLKQLLGLPPTAQYQYFIEFWVKPADLFRPCPDAEATDSQCSLCFPENATDAHQQWINENRVSRYYYCDLYAKYPWSQLGYTYDWNPKNKTHYGLSEFVIAANANIAVEAIYTTQEYLQQ